LRESVLIFFLSETGSVRSDKSKRNKQIAIDGDTAFMPLSDT